MAPRWRHRGARVERWQAAHPWRRAVLHGAGALAVGLLYLAIRRLLGWPSVYDVPTVLLVAASASLLTGAEGALRAWGWWPRDRGAEADRIAAAVRRGRDRAERLR